MRLEKSNNGQSAIEFVVLVAFVMIFLVGFMAALQINRSDRVNEQRDRFMNEVALSVRDEINLAASSTDGYTRPFTIPGNAMGIGFNVSIREGFVYLWSEDIKHSLAYYVTNVSGDVKIGPNIIEKINGTVHLNRI